LGLFSTKFSRSDSGFIFSAQPINIAIGGKWRPFQENDFKLGISGIANWSIIETQDDKNAFTVPTFGFGLLFQIDSFVYIGPLYIADFREGKPDPGWMLTFGATPDVLKFFKGD